MKNLVKYTLKFTLSGAKTMKERTTNTNISISSLTLGTYKRKEEEEVVRKH